MLKTTQANVAAIISYIVENTDSPMPEIIAVPLTSCPDSDLDWIRKPAPRSWWKHIWPSRGQGS